MLLVNTKTGKKYPFTFEAVGACNPETLALSISEIQTHNLPVTRIVSIVGLDELMAKGWMRPMLRMAQDAGIRLIVPPMSPLHEIYKGKQELRRNFAPVQGAWIGATWNNETIRECGKVLDKFIDEYGDEFPLYECFGVLVTDSGLLFLNAMSELFSKVSVFCGTSNFDKASKVVNAGANSINLVPTSVEEVKETSLGIDSAIIDVYMDPPRELVDDPNLRDDEQWYDLDTVTALAPQYIEAGAGVLKAEGTQNIGQLLDPEYLKKIAIPRQTQVFLEVWDALNILPYRIVRE